MINDILNIVRFSLNHPSFLRMESSNDPIQHPITKPRRQRSHQKTLVS